MKRGEPPYQLNVGCGRNVQQGWINLDSAALPGVDIVCDLENLRQAPIDLPGETVERFLLSHVIEHIRDALGLMQELWRLATPGAIAVIHVPHGGSDDAWEDPTHVRAYFPGSFGYFSQPFYWRADYGYRGDWEIDRLKLLVDGARCAGLGFQEIYAKTQRERNLVREMICEMRALKPMRKPRRELQSPCRLKSSLLTDRAGRFPAAPALELAQEPIQGGSAWQGSTSTAKCATWRWRPTRRSCG